MATNGWTRRGAAWAAMTAPALAAAQARGAGPPSPAATPLPDDMVIGSPHAPVLVVEYASVACPICGRWYRDVFPAFKARFVDTGRVRYVLREMLVGGEGEVAIAAAGFMLARCAGPGRYFPVVDAVFASQPKLFDQPQQTLSAIAAANGVPQARFDACVRDQANVEALNARVAANVKRDDVNSTPTFVINGRKLTPGFHTLAELSQAVSAAGGAVSAPRSAAHHGRRRTR